MIVSFECQSLVLMEVKYVWNFCCDVMCCDAEAKRECLKDIPRMQDDTTTHNTMMSTDIALRNIYIDDTGFDLSASDFASDSASDLRV